MEYAKCNIKKKWYMKYDDDKYSDIGAIVEHGEHNITLLANNTCTNWMLHSIIFISSWKSTYSDKTV